MPSISASTHSPGWDDLRFVLAVARAGSLAGAARALRVNHTTVLRRLGAYEARLGVRLFERLATGYVPTAVGEAMVASLAGIDAAIHDVERRAAGRDQRLSGTVRLATTDTLMASVLPAALARLREAHPGIVLEVSTANAFAVLTRREADIALRPTAAPPETLIGRRIAGIGYAAYAAPSYLADRRAEGAGPGAGPLSRPGQGQGEGSALSVGGAPLTPTLSRTGEGARGAARDLRREPVDWLAPDDSLRETVAARWMRANLPGVVPAIRADSFLCLRDLAAAGLGVALLPCYLGDASSGLVRWPPGPAIDLGSALWLLTHEDLRRVARIDAVVTVLATTLGAQRARIEGRSAGALEL